MKKNYSAPQLFCDDFMPDTMIASCASGDCAENTTVAMGGANCGDWQDTETMTSSVPCTNCLWGC